MTHHSVYYIMNNEGDWCGLYADGELIHEGHDVPAREWVNLISELGHRSLQLDPEDKLGEYLEVTGGRYPQELSDLLAILGEEE